MQGGGESPRDELQWQPITTLQAQRGVTGRRGEGDVWEISKYFRHRQSSSTLCRGQELPLRLKDLKVACAFTILRRNTLVLNNFVALLG